MLDTGESHLHAVVCLHSLFLDPRMFDGLVEAGRGLFRFVRPEFLGQAGRLAEASVTVSMEDCAADILQIVDGLKLGEFSIVGQSMGGDVAIRIAFARPGQVKRMVLMGASAREDSPDNIAGFADFGEQVEREGFHDGNVGVIMRILFAKTVMADLSRTDVHDVWRKRLLELEPGIAHAAQGVLERRSVVALLPRIKAATLVVSGTEDLARPPAWSDELFDGIPDAELWRIKGAGHSPVIEAGNVVVPRILAFLDPAATVGTRPVLAPGLMAKA